MDERGQSIMSLAMTWGDPGVGHAAYAGTKRLNTVGSLTREAFVHAVRDAVLATADLAPEQAARLRNAKLVYGAGDGGYRGICYFGAWQNDGEHAFVEIAATGEESAVQLAGTTVHELGHVIAGPMGGHKKEWQAACALLGLNDAQAVGHVYTMDGFRPSLRDAVAQLGEPSDGKPSFAGLSGAVAPRVGKLKPCPMGRGTRGGKSHGKGSGSRLRLWECACPSPVKVRVASDAFKATCDTCGSKFEYRGK